MNAKLQRKRKKCKNFRFFIFSLLIVSGMESYCVIIGLIDLIGFFGYVGRGEDVSGGGKMQERGNLAIVSLLG